MGNCLMEKREFIIGCDHAGFGLKELLKQLLVDQGYQYTMDVGTNSSESVDYPVFGKEVGIIVNDDPTRYFGLLICGSGLGMSMVANRFPNVRAALVDSYYMAEMARKHNDANVIVFGANIVTPQEAMMFLNTFINTSFEGGRHQRRIDNINL